MAMTTQQIASKLPSVVASLEAINQACKVNNISQAVDNINKISQDLNVQYKLLIVLYVYIFKLIELEL